ncbi:MAG: DUF2147 domain-containing protein [Paludibacteraceae bacterium]|nr:DUF2147 domain-containing protein [Paludibacteraceae bacterium]
MALYAGGDDIVGVWLDDEGNGKTEYVSAGDGVYKAKCVWLAKDKEKDGSPLKDKKNPDKSKRQQTVVGADVMTVTYEPEKNRYKMDWAYDPSWGLAVKNSGYITVKGDTMTIKAGWAFIKVTKRMTRCE